MSLLLNSQPNTFSFTSPGGLLRFFGGVFNSRSPRLYTGYGNLAFSGSAAAYKTYSPAVAGITTSRSAWSITTSKTNHTDITSSRTLPRDITS